MKKQSKPWFFIIVTILCIFNLCCYFGIRSMWSGIIRYTFDAMPYILLAVLFFTTLGMYLCFINHFYSKILAIFASIVNLIFIGLDGYIISLTLEATHYFIREFIYNLLFLGSIALIAYIWTILPKKAFLQQKWIPSALLCFLLFTGILWKYDINLFNKFDGNPVVYAVGEEYQITFTTKSKGTAWVSIDGVEYNDTYSGYRETENTIHKISVPMDVLDNAKEYTIYSKSMLLRGPYCALQGKTISKDYSWKGVIPEDGLNYYVISDNHNTTKTPYAAATYFGDDLDFLISCGDSVSWIDREADLTNLLCLAGDITQGQVPVIYARGNHETKGVKAHEYYQYVGADDEKFYYTFRLKNIWGIVLDIGEDHADDFIEYYGAAKFDDYRDEQTSFLDQVIANADTEYNAPGVDYRIGICHIPLTIKYDDDHAGKHKDEWVDRLNQMKLTMLYGGHIHELWYAETDFQNGQTVTQVEEYSGKEEGNASRIMGNANFPAILVSRRAAGQLLTDDEYVFDGGFIGLAVTSDGNETIMKYTNEKQEVLDNIISPWFSDIQYGNEIRVNNIK